MTYALCVYSAIRYLTVVYSIHGTEKARWSCAQVRRRWQTDGQSETVGFPWETSSVSLARSAHCRRKCRWPGERSRAETEFLWPAGRPAGQPHEPSRVAPKRVYSFARRCHRLLKSGVARFEKSNWTLHIWIFEFHWNFFLIFFLVELSYPICNEFAVLCNRCTREFIDIFKTKICDSIYWVTSYYLTQINKSLFRYICNTLVVRVFSFFFIYEFHAYFSN